MTFIDPSYLRTIHVGLKLGAVHKDNVSALPIGLIGLYEDALSPASNLNERKKFLDFFSVWASLKTEVSSGFVVSLLEGWTEDQVTNYIAQNSKWFNSPVTGKYILYHERLRTFVLQKVSQNRLEKCNEGIIQQSQLALQFKVGDEWERYALEYLSAHLLSKAMDIKDGGALKTLAYDTAHWSRQVEISTSFEWSKRMLNDMMLWASKYDDDEVIECALNKVDLYHLEQNDALRIVGLVAQNDIETALQRVSAFGGNDKKGLQRKFILYMLCLMELTLFESKDKSHRVEALEKLLKHLDDNLPVDYSVLNWNEFFPSYLVFQMACELAKLGIDFLIVFKRSDGFATDWILKKGHIDDLQFDVFLICVGGIDNEGYRSQALINISCELAKQGMIVEALASARDINNEDSKGLALANISSELAKQGKVEDALSCAMAINDEDNKYMALSFVSSELSKQGRVEEALACTFGIYDLYWKGHALFNISGELAKQGKGSEALDCALGINDERQRTFALTNTSGELANRGNLVEAAFVMQKALNCARGISDEYYKGDVLLAISCELVKQGKLEEALTIAHGIKNEATKSGAFTNISGELAKQGKLEEAAFAMQEAFACVLDINDENPESFALMSISGTLARMWKVEEALAVALRITNPSTKSLALKDISDEIAKQGKLEEALACAMRINDDRIKNDAFKYISGELAEQGQVRAGASAMQAALAYARGINDERDKTAVLMDISYDLAKQKKLEEALVCARGIKFEHHMYDALMNISGELAKQGKIEQALSCALGINCETQQYGALMNISAELAKQGMVDEAEYITSHITQRAMHNESWEEIGKTLYESKEYLTFMKAIRKLSNVELNNQIKAVTINFKNGPNTEIKVALNTKKDQSQSINYLEHILQMHCLNELFFLELKYERIDRYNRTLNIQWAIDIKSAINSN